MNSAIFHAVSKAVETKVEKLAVGDHPIDATVTLEDHLTGETSIIKTNGVVSQGVDYDRTATVSVSLYEFGAAILSQFGVMGKEAAKKAADAMAQVLENRLDSEVIELSKKIKTEVENLKKLFADKLPKAAVNGKTTIKCSAIFAENEKSKAV